MTLDEFVNLYNGTKVGDGQCVALIKQYEQDVLGLIPQAVGNAHDYYDNFYNQPFLYNNFDRITYTGSNIPNVGDMIVWNTNYGDGYGHIAIVYKNITEQSFTGFDQNWNIPLLCEITNHNYKNVLGWLRLKGSTPPTPSIITKNKFPWVLYMKKIRKKRCI